MNALPPPARLRLPHPGQLLGRLAAAIRGRGGPPPTRFPRLTRLTKTLAWAYGLALFCVWLLLFAAADRW